MNVFITGGVSGIGEQLALYYLERGHAVGVCSNEPRQYEASPLKGRRGLSFYYCDVTDTAAMERSLSEFAQAQGGLDLVWANAGTSHREKTGVHPIEESKKILMVNVIGVMNTFHAAVPIMRAQKRGHIAALGSAAAWNGLPGRSAYSASKAAVLKWCEAMAVDLAGDGISVSCVMPGYVQTPLTAINGHAMPFLVPAEKAARLMAEGVARKSFLIAFPWPTALFTRLLSLLPRGLYVYLLKMTQ
jgi:NAD(P)-dependent dehydrogenase (short-subunit alcohol dehydrogenase family)